MSIKRNLTLALLLASSMFAFADDYQTISINGVPVNKQVTSITADGIMVTVYYNDETHEELYAEQLAGIFTESVAVKDVKLFGGVTIKGGTLTISGLEPGTPVDIYDLSGKKWVSSQVGAEETQLNVQQLQRGTYILKSGKTVVKFQKK